MVMIQVFLPALYVIWCRVRPVEADPFETARLPEAAVAYGLQSPDLIANHLIHAILTQ